MHRSTVAAAFALLCGTTAHAASFDCGKARAPDERAICADRALNDQDVRMDVYLTVASQVQLMGGNGAMRDEQREWLTRRRACGGNRSCLARAYDERVKQLSSGWAAWAERSR